MWSAVSCVLVGNYKAAKINEKTILGLKKQKKSWLHLLHTNQTHYHFLRLEYNLRLTLINSYQLNMNFQRFHKVQSSTKMYLWGDNTRLQLSYKPKSSIHHPPGTKVNINQLTIDLASSRVLKSKYSFFQSQIAREPDSCKQTKYSLVAFKSTILSLL